MKKFIKKIALYLVVFVILGNLIGLLCQYFMASSQFYKPNYVVNALDSSTNYDYFIVGSSRGLTTVDSKQIDQSLNTNGINLSMADTDLKTQLLMVKHFYNSGYSSKNCILVLDKSHYTETYKELGGNDYRFIGYGRRDYINEHYDKYETGTIKPLSLSNYFPFAGFAYFNLELFLPSGLAALKPDFRNKFDDRGNYSYPNQNLTAPQAIRRSTTAIINNPLVKEMAALTAQYNTKLTIYIAPYINESQNVFVEDIDASIINQSDQFVGKEHLFYDDLHVTTIGREVATTALIPELKKTLKQ
ncbi:MAG: hypothetical protein WBA16_09915 [Nonlabens sp.]